MTGRFRHRKRSRLQRWRRRILWLLFLLPFLSALPVLILRVLNPPTSAFMLARQMEARAAKEADFRLDYRWRPLTEISPQLGLAVVASEDQKFPSHHGFDLKAIKDAIASNQKGGGLRGASTITQQVAKNLFLWSGRSFLRKGLEAWYTVLIELFWPKQRILEVYLNTAEFGDGIYGAEAAAQRLFGKPAARLTAPESALLAAVLPSPRRMLANRPGPYLVERQAWILRQMRQLGGPVYVHDAEQD